jgi:hypothetical protein
MVKLARLLIQIHWALTDFRLLVSMGLLDKIKTTNAHFDNLLVIFCIFFASYELHY